VPTHLEPDNREPDVYAESTRRQEASYV